MPFPLGSPDSKNEKLAQRLASILSRLHQGETLNKHRLAADFDVDVRTIERDLGQRLRGIAERNEHGLWQLARMARDTIPARRLTDYARLAGTEQLFPDTSVRYLLGQLDLPEMQRAVQVQPTPHEDLGRQGTVFARLQTAIEQRHACSFTYKSKPRHAQPYRLIHKNGVWYLAAEEAGLLKNFCVAQVEALQIHDACRFTPNAAHHDYINSQEDIWFTQGTTEVLLRVTGRATRYFSRRALLPRQQQRADDDGSLLVTAQINHIEQLLPVVRYWLPHVRIVEPKAWHEALVGGLVEALAQWSH